ncbi:reverse transcriptase domain-containing protein [Tanacetum coccineum]
MSNTTLIRHLVTFHLWDTTLGKLTYFIVLLLLWILKKISATRQGMSLVKIDQNLAQRVTDVIEAIAVYKTKICMAHDSKSGFDNKTKDVKWLGTHCWARQLERSTIATTSQRTPVANRKATVICYECGKQGYFRNECEKLKNQNHGNQKGNEGKAHEDPNAIKDNADA